MEQSCKYTLPGVTICFKSVNSVFDYLRQEGQSVHIDVKSIRTNQEDNLNRIIVSYSDLINRISKRYDVYVKGVDKFGASKINDIEKSRIINKLILNEIYLPIMIEDRFPQLKLCCLDFIKKHTYYKIILNIVNDVMPLYLEEDFSNVEMPKELSLRRKLKGEMINYTPLQYMAKYSESVYKFSPSFSMADGIIRYHLNRQLTEFNNSKPENELYEMAQIRAARIDDPRITQEGLVKRLNIKKYKIKKYLTILKNDSVI